MRLPCLIKLFFSFPKFWKISGNNFWRGFDIHYGPLQVNSEVHLNYVRGWSTKIFKFQLSRIVKIFVNIRGYIWNVYGDFADLHIPIEENFRYWRRVKEHSYRAFKTTQPYYRSIELWIWRAWEKREGQPLDAQTRATLASRVLYKLPKCIITPRSQSQKHELVLFLIDIGNKRETTLFR